MLPRLFALLCIAVIVTVSFGLKNLIVIEDDYRPLIKIETFGFNTGGSIELEISNVRLNHPDAEKKTSIDKESNKIGFLLRQAQSESEAQQDIEKAMEDSLCLFDVGQHHNNDIVVNITNYVNAESRLHEHSDLIKSTSNKEETGESALSTGISKHYTITADTAGLYTLIFQRCPSVDDGHSITFTMNAIFKNPAHVLSPGSREWDYLSAGDSPLPLMYMIFFVLFTGALLKWLTVLKRDPQQFGKVYRIHFLMALLLTFKCLTMVLESLRYGYISKHGETGVWSDLYYVFESLKGIMLFIVIALIGTGWSVVKDFLSTQEKRLLTFVLVCQVVSNVAMVYVEQDAPGSLGWVTWRDVLHLVDILCCFAILFPIIWQISHLKAASGSDGKAAATLARLQIFKSFYIGMFAFYLASIWLASQYYYSLSIMTMH